MKIFFGIVIFFSCLLCIHAQVAEYEEILKIDCTKPNNYEYGCGNCTIQNNNPYIECGGYEQGTCIEGVCQCEDEYYGSHCQNKRKNKLAAFLITLLVGPLIGIPPGAGRLYLGYKAIGAGQIILGLGWTLLFIPMIAMVVFAILSFCVTGFSLANLGAQYNKYTRGFVTTVGILTGSFCGIFFLICFACLVILTVLCGLAAYAWWLSDWIRILSDDLDDANGHKLAPW